MDIWNAIQGTNRTATRSTSRPDQGLQYEALEYRRVLATGVFNPVTSTLQIELAPSDIQILVSVDGEKIALARSTDLDPVLAGEQSVLLSEIDNIEILGNAQTIQSIVFQGDFNELNDLSIVNASHIVLDSNIQLSGDLNIDFPGQPDSSPTVGRLGDTAHSILSVGGETNINFSGGNVQLSNGQNSFAGPVNLTSDLAEGDHKIKADGRVNLNHIDVAHIFRVHADQIMDESDSSISAKRGYLKADAIQLGEQVDDFVDFDWINIKSDGFVDIQDNTSIGLMGFNYAEALNLEARDWIVDADRARTKINGLASFQAEQLWLGDNSSDMIAIAQLNFNVSTHVHIEAESAILISGSNTAGSIEIASIGDLATNSNSILDVTHRAIFVSEADISIGESVGDSFTSTTVSFAGEDGHVSIHANNNLHIIGSKNVANSLQLTADGYLTDDIEARSNIASHSELIASESIFLGEGISGHFETGTLAFQAANRVFVEHISDLILAGESSAFSANLYSQGAIGNASQATINITDRTRLIADNITVGMSDSDEFNSGWISFDTQGMVQIEENSDTILDGTNEYNRLELMSVGDITLMGETNGHHSYLESGGTISNAANTVFSTTNNLNLVASLVRLGQAQGDELRSGSLTFDTVNDARIHMESHIQLVGNNSAKSFDLTSEGNIHDADSATIVATLLGRFSGVDIVIGDDESNCFSVSTGTVLVTASGLESVNHNSCSISLP